MNRTTRRRFLAGAVALGALAVVDRISPLRDDEARFRDDIVKRRTAGNTYVFRRTVRFVNARYLRIEGCDIVADHADTVFQFDGRTHDVLVAFCRCSRIGERTAVFTNQRAAAPMLEFRT